MTSDEERKRRSMGTPVWPLNNAAHDDRFRQPPYDTAYEVAIRQSEDAVHQMVMGRKQGMEYALEIAKGYYERYRHRSENTTPQDRLMCIAQADLAKSIADDIQATMKAVSR